MRTDFLRALAPVTPSTAVYGDMLGAVRTARIVPDASTQPPRIYSLLVTGGGVLYRADAAEAMRQAGFDVASFTPTAIERAWLVKLDPTFRTATQFWSVSCSQPVYEIDGNRRCGTPRGLKVISEEDALATGAVDKTDLGEPLKHVDPRSVRGYRFYSMADGAGLPGAAMVAQAIRSVRELEHMRARIDDILVRQKRSGIPVSPATEGHLAAAARVLAMYAQPAAELRKGYQGLRATLLEKGVPNADQLPVDPFPKFGEPITLSTSFLIGLGIVAVIVVAAMVAVIVLANAWLQISEASQQVDMAEATQRQQMLDCVSNPAIDAPTKRGCQRALKELTKQSEERTERGQDANPFSGLEDSLKWIAGIAALGFAAVYFGPVLREASQTAAGQIQTVRQRRQASRQQALMG
jgi:hypothetical protein